MKYPLLRLLFLTLVVAGCSKDNSLEDPSTAWLEISITPEMNGSPFTLNSTYNTIYGELLQPTAFKFYIGQLQLDLADGSRQSFDRYYLADLSDTASLRIRVQVPPGHYTALQYQLGIDSARNVSGVQSGVLDPLRGMFWTWNSGYIFYKLEGSSPVSSQPGNAFEYHIGGFRTPYSAIRVQQARFETSESWPLESGKTLQVDLACQLDNFFSGTYPLRIAENPTVMTPGALSAQLADNFAGCFSVSNYQIR